MRLALGRAGFVDFPQKGRMMDVNACETKTALILSAGPLFCDKGEDGANVRAIAAGAGANIASINYHFRSKSSLYLETVRFAINSLQAISFHKAWQALPLALRTPDHIRHAIAAIIRQAYRSIIQDNLPRWQYGLIQREFSAPTHAFALIKNEIVAPGHSAAHDLFALLRPHYRAIEPTLWFNHLFGQFLFFALAGEALKNIYGWKEAFDLEYAEQAIRTSTRLALLPLESAPDREYADDIAGKQINRFLNMESS